MPVSVTLAAICKTHRACERVSWRQGYGGGLPSEGAKRLVGAGNSAQEALVQNLMEERKLLTAKTQASLQLAA